MPSPPPARYDAFLSYNSLDHHAVHRIAEKLRAERLELYLEEWELAPGREFLPALAEGLRDSKTCVVFLGPNGLGPWQEQELQVAIDRRVRDTDFHLIPVLIPGSKRPRRGDVAHLEFLINASWVEFLKTLDDDNAFRRLVWGITGRKPPSPLAVPPADAPCPYPGLEAYGRDDAKLFFGRDTLTDWLVSDLRREVAAEHGVRLLPVLGPSGSGKSSIVLAGLVPRLEAGRIGDDAPWEVVVIRPGADPLASLADELWKHFIPAWAPPDVSWTRKFTEDLARNKDSLHRYANQALRDPKARLLIVVDQFEEAFTNRPADESVRTRHEESLVAFFDNLLHAAGAPGGRTSVVITMRSDFLGACAAHPRLNDLMTAHLVQVGPMLREELREAIEAPAHSVGCEVASDLVERLLNDVEGRPGALPLMQFALQEVWKSRDGRVLRLDAYEKLGGISGALEKRADKFYDGLSTGMRELCQLLFLRMVQPGEGVEDTRRRATIRELLPREPGRVKAMRCLIKELSARENRLVTTAGKAGDEGTVEIAHEALIHGWPRLRAWLSKERENVRTRLRLVEAAREYEQAAPAQKGDFLYAGARLATAREWADAHQDEIGESEFAFLIAGGEAELREEQQKLKAAEAMSRRLRVRSRFSIAAAALALAAACVAFLQAKNAFEQRQKADKEALNALQQKGKADEEARNALQQKGKADELTRQAVEQAAQTERRARVGRAARFASEAVGSIEVSPERALLLAAEAVRATTSAGEAVDASAESALHQVLGTTAGVPVLRLDDPLRTFDASADGKSIAAISSRGAVYLVKLDGSAVESVEAVGGADPMDLVAISPDGRFLATWGKVCRLWPLQDRLREPRTLDLPEGADLRLSNALVAFRPGRDRIVLGRGIYTPALGTSQADVRIFDVNRPADVPTILPTGPGGVAWKMAPNGRWLATSSDVGTVSIYDLDRPAQPPRVYDKLASGLAQLQYRPDSRMLGVGSVQLSPGTPLGSSIHIIDLDLPDAKPKPVATTDRYLEWFSLQPNGDLLTIERDKSFGSALLLRGNAGMEVIGQFPSEKPQGMTRASTEPSSTRVILGAYERVGTRSAIKAIGVINLVRPDGPTLSGFLPEMKLLRGHDRHITQFKGLPNSRLVSSAKDGTLRVFDLEQEAYPHAVLRGHGMSATSGIDAFGDTFPNIQSVEDVVIQDGGRRIATTDPQGVLRLWDLSRAHEGCVTYKSQGTPSIAFDFLTNETGLIGLSGCSPDERCAGRLSLIHLIRRDFAPVTVYEGDEPIVAAKALADGRHVLVHTTSKPGLKLRIVDLEKPTAEALTIADGKYGSLRWLAHPNLKGVIIVDVAPETQRSTLKLFDLDGRSSKTLGVYDGDNPIVAVNEDGGILAIAMRRTTSDSSYSSTIRFWDLARSVELGKAPRVQAGSVGGLAFEPGGHLCASANGDGQVCVWDLQQPDAEPLKFQVGAPVRAICFDPRGKRLATGQDDGTVTLWRLAAKGPVDRVDLPIHREQVTQILFDRESGRLVTGGSDGNVVITELEVDKLLDVAERRAGRNFSRAEWTQAMGDEPYRKSFEKWPEGR